MRAGLLKPEYAYQPKRLFRRLLPIRPQVTSFGVHSLPWSRAQLRVRESEEHGQILRTLGVVDLMVTESLFRLADPGEVAVDVGANVGYMTNVLVSRIGQRPGAKMWSFEAHPAIHVELSHNVHELASAYPEVEINAPHCAISSQVGSVLLTEPAGFATNRGLANVQHSETGESVSHRVQCNTLDNLIPRSQRIGAMKIDVEGHELDVLQGATRMLAERRIRDCVFEEHSDYPCPVTTLLEDAGYTVFFLKKRFSKPQLAHPSTAEKARTGAWVPVSFLATLDPDRAHDRFRASGWHCLSNRWRNANR